MCPVFVWICTYLPNECVLYLCRYVNTYIMSVSYICVGMWILTSWVCPVFVWVCEYLHHECVLNLCGYVNTYIMRVSYIYVGMRILTQWVCLIFVWECEYIMRVSFVCTSMTWLMLMNLYSIFLVHCSIQIYSSLQKVLTIVEVWNFQISPGTLLNNSTITFHSSSWYFFWYCCGSAYYQNCWPGVIITMIVPNQVC